MDSGVRLTDVTLRIGDFVILDRQSFFVPPGSCLVITGENGVGKSTVLYLAAGLVRPTRGTVTLDGHRPDLLDPGALFRAGVRRGFVFQQGGLISNLSVLANVALALRFHADVLGLDEAGALARARSALTQVGVLDEADIQALPAHLSFGERKRAAMARALALDPSFVFFDDPDAGLDGASEALVHDLLIRYRDDPKVTMVVATNHLALLQRLGLSPVELTGGHLVEGVARSVA